MNGRTPNAFRSTSSFKDEVERLAQRELDVDAVMRMSRDTNAYVACMALAALAERDDVPQEWTDSAVRALRRVPNEVEPFVYGALVKHAAYPVIGPALAQLDEGINWQYLARFVRDRRADRRARLGGDIPGPGSDPARSDDRITHRQLRGRARRGLPISVRGVAWDDCRPRFPEPVRTHLGATIRRSPDVTRRSSAGACRVDARFPVAEATPIGSVGRGTRNWEDCGNAHRTAAARGGSGASSRPPLPR